MRPIHLTAIFLLSLILSRADAMKIGNIDEFPSGWELGFRWSIKVPSETSGEECASRMIHHELDRENHGKFKDLIVDTVVRAPNLYGQDRFEYYAHDRAQNQFSGEIFSEMRDAYDEDERSGSRMYYKICTVLGRNTIPDVEAQFSLENSQGTKILSGD
jgi:hypothetical protein